MAIDDGWRYYSRYGLDRGGKRGYKEGSRTGKDSSELNRGVGSGYKEGCMYHDPYCEQKRSIEWLTRKIQLTEEERNDLLLDEMLCLCATRHYAWSPSGEIQWWAQVKRLKNQLLTRRSERRKANAPFLDLMAKQARDMQKRAEAERKAREKGGEEETGRVIPVDFRNRVKKRDH